LPSPLPLDARLPVFCTPKTPTRRQRRAQRRLVIEIALDDVDAAARQRRRLSLSAAVMRANGIAPRSARATARLRVRTPVMRIVDRSRMHHEANRVERSDSMTQKSCWR